MEDYRININYAKALFLVASDEKVLDDVNRDMRAVYKVCSENHILNTVFANPFIREGKKVAILNDLFGNEVTKVSKLFLDFVVKKRRAINLKGIANSFIELYRKHNDIVLSHLTTATELDGEALDAVRKRLGNYTKKDIELETTVDPEILGGFCVEFDGNMYDATLSTQVAKLRKEFSKNVYESKL